MLRHKSLHQLRGIAQSYGISDIFSMDDKQLIQAIEIKQQAHAVPAPIAEIPQPQYDARLMTKPPSKRSDEQSIREMLAGHVARGLHLSFTNEGWRMQWEKRADEGTLRMPLRVVLHCANQIMK